MGISRNPDKRISDLQGANPFPLILWLIIDPVERGIARQVERHFHMQFNHLRMRGEWFDFRDHSELPSTLFVNSASEILADFEYEIALRDAYGESIVQQFTRLR